MLIQEKSTMTESEKISVRNTNIQFLEQLCILPVGFIGPFGGDTAPSGWLICNGQTVSKTTYPDLFAVVGYKYGGSGDNFKVPNAEEAAFIGYKNGSTLTGTLGTTVGNNTHEITINEMPSHDHAIYQNPNQSGSAKAGNGIFDTGGYNARYADMNTYTQYSGGGQAISLVSKNVVVNFIIKSSSGISDLESATGKGLSVNDYSDTEKAKVDSALQPDDIDQTYSATSENAQSGVAVAEALQNQYTNTLTTLATVTDSNGGKLLNVDIIGKSIQDGTPTPTTPIAIQNVGNTLTLKSGVSADDTNATIYTIPLTDINGTSHIMRQFDEVKKHDDGKWYFDCNTNEIMFNGNEEWHTFQTNVYIVIQGTTAYGKSNRSVQVEAISPANLLAGNHEILSNGILYVGTSTTTVSDWRALLAEWNTAGNPFTVMYQMQTVTSYELSATTSEILENIAIQKGNANIYFTNAVAPTMTADYPQDLQLYCKSLEARIEALENIQ